MITGKCEERDNEQAHLTSCVADERTGARWSVVDGMFARDVRSAASARRTDRRRRCVDDEHQSAAAVGPAVGARVSAEATSPTRSRPGTRPTRETRSISATLSEGFRNWRLPISGLVERPRELSLDEIRSLPARTQITAHVCEQGWSAIGEWTGAPLQRVLEAAGGVTPAARYVVIDTFDGWYEGYDLFEVEHPQTILAYGLNGRDLPRGNGAPLRLRVERQCGYKNLKFLKSIQVVDSMAGFGRGTGGTNSDFGFHWFAGV